MNRYISYLTATCINNFVSELSYKVILTMQFAILIACLHIATRYVAMQIKLYVIGSYITVLDIYLYVISHKAIISSVVRLQVLKCLTGIG